MLSFQQGGCGGAHVASLRAGACRVPAMLAGFGSVYVARQLHQDAAVDWAWWKPEASTGASDITADSTFQSHFASMGLVPEKQPLGLCRAAGAATLLLQQLRSAGSSSLLDCP